MARGRKEGPAEKQRGGGWGSLKNTRFIRDLQRPLPTCSGYKKKLFKAVVVGLQVAHWSLSRDVDGKVVVVWKLVSGCPLLHRLLWDR